MARYPKFIRSIEIHQMLDSETTSLSDELDNGQASLVLAQFANYKDLEWVSGNEVTVVPYHAVQYIKVTEAVTEKQKADPYYCEDDTEGGN